MEGHEWVFVDGKYVQKNIEEVKTALKRTSSAGLNEAKLRAFQHFLGKIR
jgi:hypothetical protein